jgi:hypothetical protein
MLPYFPSDALSGSSQCLGSRHRQNLPDFANMKLVYHPASIAAVLALFSQLILALIVPTDHSSLQLAKRITRPHGFDCTMEEKERLNHAFEVAPTVVSSFFFCL